MHSLGNTVVKMQLRHQLSLNVFHQLVLLLSHFCFQRVGVHVTCLLAIRWQSCTDNDDSNPSIHLYSALQFTRDFKYVISSNYHNNTLKQVLIYSKYSGRSKYSLVKKCIEVHTADINPDLNIKWQVLFTIFLALPVLILIQF